MENNKVGSTTEQEGAVPMPPAPGGEPVIVSNGLPPFAGLEGISFGRYNDNNKSYAKTRSWYSAEDLYKEKKYTEAFAAFFDYITDKDEDNVIFRPDGDRFTFEIIQGSKKIYGSCDGTHIIINAPIALMETPSTAVMRRMLDLNYTMYYSRCALNDKNELCIMMDTSVPLAAPNKMYYGLRELSTKADRQDDTLLADFSSLKPANADHIQPLPEKELDVKYKYFRQWISDTLTRAASLNQDSFSGAIAYLYLSLLYRIEFLIIPEAKLLTELERISSLYWTKKDEVALVERNQLMKEAISKLPEITKEEFAAGAYRTRNTFAIAPPAPLDKYKENILAANRDATWYMDNKYPDLALVLNEYGVVYNQFAYSIPKLQKDLTRIYMAVVHAGFFTELGMAHPFYDPATGTFNRAGIEQAVNDAINYLADKYVNLQWDHEKVKYDSLFDFAISFTDQLAHLHIELKK